MRKGSIEVVEEKFVGQFPLAWDGVNKEIGIPWRVCYTDSDRMFLEIEDVMSEQVTFNGVLGGGLTIYTCPPARVIFK